MFKFPREIGLMAYDPSKPDKRFPLKRAFVTDIDNLEQFYDLYKEKYNLYTGVFNQRNSYDGWKTPNVPYDFKLSSRCDRLAFDIDCKTNLTIAHNEVIQLYHYIKEEYGGEPLLIFSGQKGFHLYMYFTEIQVDWKYIRQFQEDIVNKLELEFVDPAILGDASRVLRLPFSTHQSASRACIPVNPQTSLEDIISNSENYQTDCIHPIPIDQRRGITPPIKELQIAGEIQRRLQYKNKVKFEGNSDNVIQNWNVMDRVFPILHETGKQVGTRWIVKCPHHQDTHASAYYSTTTFYCSVCNINLGVYNYLTKIMGYDRDKANNIIREVQ